MILASGFLNQLKAVQAGQAFEIKPVYLLYGEEPLFLRDCHDSLRTQLQQQGYLTGDFYEVDANFNWQTLQMATQAGSLFSEQRMILVSMPKGAPGVAGTQFIQDWCARTQMQVALPEMVLVFLCERLDARQSKAKWVSAIESAGLVVQAKSVPLAALPGWCQQKANTLGLQLDTEAATLLAQRVEGNLLAADQELLKLSLLFAPADFNVNAHNVHAPAVAINVQTILDNVVDQAHYQLFALGSAMLNGQVASSVQMLTRLREEGVEAPIILWLLTTEIRQLAALRQLSMSMSVAQALKQLHVWSSQHAQYSAALKRKKGDWSGLLAQALQIDLMIKGITPTLGADPIWHALLQLIVDIASDR
ncbi:DNA polymerase III subunit delta [Thiomicrorhabdus aquaedulcis]|uniref:DNA polymerase III subunit delta n=1 Tax=Thiomicrorhabdus aquaedulcis TaxID=2211106 RepID=UPI000FDA51A6|nr:DNA polymerase III subunit delta [Thiomicrorhabdus aquaedulcis]